MKLIDLYSLMESGQVTQAQAAVALDISEKQLKLRMAQWGHKLPMLFATLDKIAEKTISTKEAAEVMGTTDRNMRALISRWKVTKPPSEYLVENARAEVKWEIRKKFAIDFISSSMTIEEAADGAEVSIRQMRRWVAALLKKHYAMTTRELTSLPPLRRKRLADEMEEAERLDLAKQNVLKAISDGRKPIEEEALERVHAKKFKGGLKSVQ